LAEKVNFIYLFLIGPAVHEMEVKEVLQVEVVEVV